MYKRGVGLRYGGGSRGGRGGRGRRRLLGLADFGVALSKLQPDGLGQVGIETDTLLQFDKFFRYVKATLFFIKSGNLHLLFSPNFSKNVQVLTKSDGFFGLDR